MEFQRRDTVPVIGTNIRNPMMQREIGIRTTIADLMSEKCRSVKFVLDSRDEKIASEFTSLCPDIVAEWKLDKCNGNKKVVLILRKKPGASKDW